MVDDAGEALGFSTAKKSFNHGTLGKPLKKPSIVGIPFDFAEGVRPHPRTRCPFLDEPQQMSHSWPREV
jgi:hypothetical protein